MSIAERSIKFHRNTFTGLITFTVISVIIMAIILGNYEYKLMVWMLPIFTFLMSIPTIRAYRNWIFIIKNKKELDSLNLNVDENVIFFKKKLF
jgi:uncharacterized membrane protein